MRAGATLGEALESYRIAMGVARLPDNAAGLQVRRAVFDAAAHAVMPKVAILLCTCHGQRYLAEQLDSFEAQTHANWEIWASDDCSKDETNAILETYRDKWKGRFSIHCGPAEGFVANFLFLTGHAAIEADCYAYSDQDDIWEADKLQRAVSWLKTVPDHVPALYCSRTRLVDAEDNEIGLSPLFDKPPSFANALMQNIGGGNTMVFNRATRELLREAGRVDVITHDWWAYLVVTGCGGKVFYDTHPSLRYRQHDANLVGMNSSWQARLVRVRMLWQGRFRDLNDRHILALQRISHRLTPESRSILERFINARDRWLVPRIVGLYRSGVYRQTLLGNMGLLVAGIFRKM